MAYRYNWGPEIVKKLTAEQQIMYLESDKKETMTFDTLAEYKSWKHA